MTTTEEYNHFIDTVRRSKPSETYKMLQLCDELLPILREDNSFRKLRANAPLVQKMVELQSMMLEGHKSYGKMWFSALKVTASAHDIDALIMQLALFLTAQELKLHFVEDDGVRLGLAYLHLRIIKHTIEIETIL